MYETEDQQVEALKKWWKENGKSIIAGVVIGLAAVFGWRGWTQYTDGVGAQASNAFDQLVLATETGDLDSASKQAELLIQGYGSTPYAGFAELTLARIRFDQGDRPGAAAALERAIDRAPDRALRTVAVLRLARLRIDEGNLDGAAALLDKHPSPAAFAGEYAVLRGDIAAARGDVAAARSAYQQAIAGEVSNADLVQLKLDNLPPAS